MGSLVQFFIVLAVTNHLITVPVLLDGIRVLTTYHPFCALLRPSYKARSPSSDRIVKRLAASSGANTSVLPVANGKGSVVPFALIIVGPDGYKGNTLLLSSIRYVL